MEKYDKIKVVGRGAYGTVHLCKRLTDKKLVIIKQIPVEQMTKDQRLAALNEVIVLSMLNHPNIIQYYENFLEDKALMIVMEYAEGGTLFDYLQQRNGQLLSEDEILRYFVQMLMSLQHVHSKQILHRDLKTHNILLDKNKEVVKISDFGISKVLSKSKAVTVVGTPCYISPELCESKPYNQKSDIWALGCVLFELATLKRAFDAQTLPALVLKIMRGNIAPIPDHYSDELRQLLTGMLQLEPNKRPSVNQILATPLLLPYLVTMYCDVGMLSLFSRMIPSTSCGETGLRKMRADMPSLKENNGMSKVFMWGPSHHLPKSLCLPNGNVQLAGISVGKDNRIAVTESGRIVTWELDVMNLSRNMTYEYPPRFLEGNSAVTIKRVACGDLFNVCITDTGILMTFGYGTTNCLGHEGNADLKQAKIVEKLLGYEVTDVACGTSHVVAITSDNEVFAWGRGDYGRLGLGDDKSRHLPEQLLALPDDVKFRSVHATTDASMLITEGNKVFATGNNRFNKLGLNKSFNDDSPGTVSGVKVFMPVVSDNLDELDIKTLSMGYSHCALVTTSGECWCMGSNQFGQLGIPVKNKQALNKVVIKTSKKTPHQPNEGVTSGESERSTDDHEIEVELIVKSVSCGNAHTVAEASDGSIWSWGQSEGGRLGRHTLKKKQSDWKPGAVEIPVLENYKVINIASSHNTTIVAFKYEEPS